MSSRISRRQVNQVLFGGALASLFGGLAHSAALPAVRAYRNPGCGCCEKWGELMKQAGFALTMEDDPDLADRKTSLGVPTVLAGCHTAIIGQYVIEGHVPPADVIRFLNEKSSELGLAVAGMPMESAGMETGGTPENYDVVAFGKDATTRIYASY